MTAPRTIDRETAAQLYQLVTDGDGHGIVKPDLPLVEDFDEDLDGWTVLGSSPSGTSRWHERYWLVLRDDAGYGDVYGLKYGVGLTENQEDDLPWERGTGPLALVRLYPYVITRTEYRPSHRPPGAVQGDDCEGCG